MVMEEDVSVTVELTLLIDPFLFGDLNLTAQHLLLTPKDHVLSKILCLIGDFFFLIVIQADNNFVRYHMFL